MGNSVGWVPWALFTCHRWSEMDTGKGKMWKGREIGVSRAVLTTSAPMKLHWLFPKLNSVSIEPDLGVSCAQAPVCDAL